MSNSNSPTEKKQGNTASRIYELAKPLADELGLILWDVCFEKEGTTWYLRVFIDREDEYVTIEDCESFSRRFNVILDELDPISQSYVFEVGGPGLARELKRPEHFERFLGEQIRIRLIREADGLKEFICELNSFDKNELSVTLDDGRQLIIKTSETAFVKLYDDGDLAF